MNTHPSPRRAARVLLPAIVFAMIAGFLLVVLGCRNTGQIEASNLDRLPASEMHPGEDAAPFDDLIIDVVAEYRSWQRVSDYAYQAPTDCMWKPRHDGPVLSDSHDTATHGQKYYYLYQRDTESTTSYDYSETSGGQPIGQTFVKEALYLESASVAPFDFKPLGSEGLDLTKTYRLIEIKEPDLYVMHKVDPATPGTDEGWIYAVLTADGSTVREAGRIASCMRCHTSDKASDRMFGPAWKRRDEQRLGPVSSDWIIRTPPSAHQP